MYVFDYIFISSFVVCRTPYLLSLLILTLRKFPKMFRWKTVGMLVCSFSLPATCVRREESQETPKECILQMLP